MMKTITTTSLGIALLCGLLVTPKMASGDDKRELSSNLQRASELIGKKVENESGENLGKIEEIVIETSDGSVAYAVLSFGGFLGIGDKYFAIPWQALKENHPKKVCVLSVDKERLKNAPGFDKKNWPDMARPEFRDEIHKFYNVAVLAPGRTYSGEPGWADWEFARADLSREAVQLPLNLKEGTTLRYRATGQDHGAKETSKESSREVSREPARPTPAAARTGEADLQLRIVKVSGGESTVEVTANCKETGTHTCTARVSKDGTLSFDPPAKTDQAGETASRANDAKAQMVLRHIFGQGLHNQKLEAGKEYSMLGSLSHHEPTTTPREREREVGSEAGAATATGSHLMRFDGVARRGGKALAIFTIASSPADLRAGAASRTEQPRAGSELAGGRLGKAAYRLDDGLLEMFNASGCSLRRIDDVSGKLGN